eukprot:4606566-Amphidinium_carterae.3
MFEAATHTDRACEAGVILADSFRAAHTHIPCSLGEGASNLTHKASSLLHSIAVECVDRKSMLAYLRGCMSWTSDLGTEAGLSALRVTADSLLPPWWTWPDEADGELEVGALKPMF